MYLNYFTSIQQILSGRVVSVVYWTVWVVAGFEFYCLSYQFFFLQIKETCPFMNIWFPAWIDTSSKCDIKAENSSTLCKFHAGRKGLRPMGSNADRLTAGGFSSKHNFCLNQKRWKSTLFIVQECFSGPGWIFLFFCRFQAENILKLFLIKNYSSGHFCFRMYWGRSWLGF